MGGDSDNSAQLASIETALTRLADKDDIDQVRHAHLTKSLDELVKSNTQLSESVNGLVNSQLSIRHDLDRVEELQDVRNSEFVLSIDDLKGRVRILERFNDQNHGERRASDKRKNWWNENWYKLLGFFILCIPLIDFLYERVTGRYDEHTTSIERSKSDTSISTKH